MEWYWYSHVLDKLNLYVGKEIKHKIKEKKNIKKNKKKNKCEKVKDVVKKKNKDDGNDDKVEYMCFIFVPIIQREMCFIR